MQTGHLHKLVEANYLMTELPISAKQAYQISEQAHTSGAKAIYTKHDFLELRSR